MQHLTRLDGIHLLVIDDDSNLRSALAVLFQRRGAVVETAAGPVEARALLGRVRPDAIVCDIAMPGENGYLFLRWLRASGDPACDVPVVAFTAQCPHADVDVQFDAHVDKASDFERLASTVHNVGRRRRN